MDDPGPTASDIVHFKASQQLLNPNEEPPPKRSKTNPVQDLARKHIRIAKKIDLNVDDIILRLTADFTPPIKAAVAGQTIEIVKALFVQTGYDTKRFLDIFFKEGDCELINDADESLRYLMTKLVLIIRSKGRSSMKFADVSICRRDDDTNNLCLVFGHHDLPKFKFQMIDIIQTLPTKIHGSESFELLKEKAKITTRAQRDTKLKEKKLNAKVESKEIDESIQQDEEECDEEAENDDEDQAEELTDELLNETLQYVAELIDKNQVPEEISQHFDEIGDLLWIVLKSGKYNDRSSPINFKAEEKEVVEKLHFAFQSFFLNPSPRLNHSLEVATIICTYARLLKHGKSWVQQFRKEIHGEIQEDTAESEKNLNGVLTNWLEAIDAEVIKQFQKNGFKSEYPLSIREASITSGTRHVVRFFCYLSAAHPEIIPTNFLKSETLVKDCLEEWQRHLCVDYTRQSHFHSAEKNFAEGIKDASRMTYEDEPSRIRLLTAVKIYSSTVTGLKLFMNNKGFLNGATSKASLKTMVKLYENKRASCCKTMYAITPIDSDYLMNVSPPKNVYELQRAILVLMASQFGCRLGSMIPLVDSSCEAVKGSPGIQLKDLSFQFVTDPVNNDEYILKLTVKICHHKTQTKALGVIQYSTFVTKKKYCLVKLILQLLSLRGVLNSAIEEGIRAKKIFIQHQYLNEQLFVKPENTTSSGFDGSIYNRLTVDPLTPHFIRPFRHR